MSLIYSVAILFIFWSACYLINTFLLECSITSAFYAKFLSKNGLSVNFLKFKWHTVRCNRLFMRISNWRPSFWKWWFNLGAIFSVVGQFGSLILLCYTLYDFFRHKPKAEQILVPVIPGVNLPSNQIAYYLITLFVCGIVHEFGHAIAASREQVRVNGFGVFLAFIFPGAYVDLCSEHLIVISTFRQLRIFCGGVWHNLILVLLSLALLEVHPYLVKLLFVREAYVANVMAESPLKSIVETNTVIKAIDDCKVNTMYSWYDCLYNMDMMNNQNGHCMQLDEIFRLATNTNLKTNFTTLNECCSESTSTNYCFNWLSSPVIKSYYACLPARYTTDKVYCSTDSDCKTASIGQFEIVNAAANRPQAKSSVAGGLLNRMMKEADEKNEQVCLKPVTIDNSTRLIRISNDRGPPILYVGSVQELIHSVQIGEYVPRFRFIPKFLNTQLQLLLKYMVAFSGAIGILNLVPCFALDGQYILASLLKVYSQPHNLLEANMETEQQRKVRPYLYFSLMIFGTSLLVLNILLAMFSLIRS